MRTSRAVAVSALLAVAAVNLLSACTPEDDSDVFTPEQAEPTPMPTTAPDFHCQIVWASQNVDVPALLDVFVLDAPEAMWVAGVNTLGGFTAFYQPGLDVTGNAITGAPDEDGAVTASTSNAFALTLAFNGTNEDAEVALANTTTAGLFVIGTDGSATAAEAGYADSYDFDGVWSSRDVSDNVELGTGSADLVLGTGTATTAVSLGDHGTFAVCYDVNGVAFQAHPVTAANLNLMRRR